VPTLRIAPPAWVTGPAAALPVKVEPVTDKMPPFALIALGQTLVVLTGGIDLSVGSVYALGGVLAASGSRHGSWLAFALPLVVCGAIGLGNGLLVDRAGLPPFIVTLTTLLFARGLLHWVMTRIYFPEDAHDGDPVLSGLNEAERKTLIAVREEDGYRFDVRLQGPDETAFFAI